MNSYNLAQRLLNLENQLNSLNTSQIIGQGSGILIPVFEIDASTNFTIGTFPEYNITFESEDTFKPIIMPYVDVRVNNVVSNDFAIVYDTLGMFFTDGYDPTNPKQTICSIQIPGTDVFPSGSLTIKGIVYANCRGVARGRLYTQ